MIRPITVFCWILALGAGLYLYRAKHEVELMDRQIDQIARQTSDLRSQSRHLLDEWIRLGEPEQLHKFSDEYLGLKTISPAQFARLSDLAGRMPQPRPDPPDQQIETAAQPPDGALPEVAAGADQPTVQAHAGADPESVDEEDLPVPPLPPVATLAAATAPPAPPLQARPVTPRPAAGQTEADGARQRAGDAARIAGAPAARTLPAGPVGARPGPMTNPAGINPPGINPPGINPPGINQAGIQMRDLPPPAQGRGPGPGSVQVLPPLQGQGPMQGPVPGAGGQPAYQPPRTQPQPVEPRGMGTQMVRQPPAQMPVQAGSLLGAARGTVPLPLPAPTPVSATYRGVNGPNSNERGR